MQVISEHTKYYNSNKIEVPSCTNIVKLLAKPELINWANYMGFKKINTTQFIQEKAIYGTYYHNIAEIYFNGLLSSTDHDKSIVSSYKFKEMIDRLDYLRLKFDEVHLKIINAELIMHGEKFGGTLDLLLYQENTGKYILIDFKTSKSVYESHLIQLGGYSLLLEEIFGINVSMVGIILLSQPVSSNRLINLLPRSDNKVNENIFLKLLDIYWLKKSS